MCTYALCKLQVTEIFYEKLHSHKIFWTAENIENPVLMHYANFKWQKYFMKNCIPRKFSGLQKILKIQYLCIMQTSIDRNILWKIAFPENFLDCRKYWKSSTVLMHYANFKWQKYFMKNCISRKFSGLQKILKIQIQYLKKKKFKKNYYFFFFFHRNARKNVSRKRTLYKPMGFWMKYEKLLSHLPALYNQWDFHLNARKNVSRKWTLYKPMGFWMKYEKLLSHLPALYKPMGFSSVQASAIKVSRTSFKIP